MSLNSKMQVVWGHPPRLVAPPTLILTALNNNFLNKIVFHDCKEKYKSYYILMCVNQQV